MKATTTVTTSSYYGNTSAKATQQSHTNIFISPQQMLRRLIPYANVQKQKENIKPVRQQFSTQSVNKTIVIEDIQHLQTDLNNIHAQIIESQNLLNVRDSLYGQLDMLRQQRQLIESDIGYLQTQYSTTNSVKINIRPHHGYREMNERLRRRMNEIRQYIHKMELENRKIDENINYSNMLNIEKNYRTQMTSNAWVDNAYFDQRERGMGKIDQLITRLHQKQDEAIDRARRQEEEINRRNQLSRASYTNNGMMNTNGGMINTNSMMNTQVPARTYHAPSDATGRRRFYSPQYRY